MLQCIMLDSHIRPFIDPPLNRLGVAIARAGIAADALTLTGFACGMAAAAATIMHWMWLALALFLAGRLIDGLDGAVARTTAKTDRGGYLDIVLDFAVYATIPLAFALADPVANALAAAVLLAAIVVNGSAFLAYAIMAERRGVTTVAHGEKSLYYLAGLAEGTETIVAYTACLLWPQSFVAIAYVFASLCFVSGLARIVIAWRTLSR